MNAKGGVRRGRPLPPIYRAGVDCVGIADTSKAGCVMPGGIKRASASVLNVMHMVNRNFSFYGANQGE